MKKIHVSAGAIEDPQGRILVTKRPDHVHQGGLWEFPGGKLEHGEAPQEGLARELFEELGIRVRSARPLIRVHHDYGDRHVLLDVYLVREFVGEPKGLEGQPISWVHPEEMDPGIFPAADRPIITSLRLPPLYLISGEDPRDRDTFFDRLSRVLAAGVRLVQLRAHDLCDADYAGLAEGAYGICARQGARLLLNRDPLSVRELPCHGLHLTSKSLAVLEQKPLGNGYLVGASCHGLGDLERAACLGLDYALLSPVEATASHPDASPLGWGRFAALADRAALPVYALGGLGPRDLDRAFMNGAQGIAAIRGLWPE